MGQASCSLLGHTVREGVGRVPGRKPLGGVTLALRLLARHAAATSTQFWGKAPNGMVLALTCPPAEQASGEQGGRYGRSTGIGTGPAVEGPGPAGWTQARRGSPGTQGSSERQGAGWRGHGGPGWDRGGDGGALQVMGSQTNARCPTKNNQICNSVLTPIASSAGCRGGQVVSSTRGLKPWTAAGGRGEWRAFQPLRPGTRPPCEDLREAPLPTTMEEPLLGVTGRTRG